MQARKTLQLGTVALEEQKIENRTQSHTYTAKAKAALGQAGARKESQKRIVLVKRAFFN
jgi:hypothetical protein